MSEKLIVYAVPATTVAFGVRVRLPLVQAAVAPKIAGDERSILPEPVVDPKRPLSTTVVFLTVP